MNVWTTRCINLFLPRYVKIECMNFVSAQMQLLADIIFKQQTGDGWYLQRRKFLETFVSRNHEGSKIAQSLPGHYQHDSDLIIL